MSFQCPKECTISRFVGLGYGITFHVNTHFLFFFPRAGVPVLCPSTHRMIEKFRGNSLRPTANIQPATTDGGGSNTNYAQAVYGSVGGGGDVFRFQEMPVHPRGKKSFMSIDNRVNNDSCGLFHNSASTTPACSSNRMMKTSNCTCFVSTFLRFRSEHQSTQWQGRTCDLQAIYMSFVFLWSTQPMKWWPWMRKPIGRLENSSQTAHKGGGSGPWSLNSNWVLTLFLWSSFLWKCTAKKWLIKAFQHVHTKTKAKFRNNPTNAKNCSFLQPTQFSKQISMLYPVRLTTSETPCLAEWRRVVGGMGFNAWSFDLCFLFIHIFRFQSNYFLSLLTDL